MSTRVAFTDNYTAQLTINKLTGRVLSALSIRFERQLIYPEVEQVRERGGFKQAAEENQIRTINQNELNNPLIAVKMH